MVAALLQCRHAFKFPPMAGGTTRPEAHLSNTNRGEQAPRGNYHEIIVPNILVPPRHKSQTHTVLFENMMNLFMDGVLFLWEQICVRLKITVVAYGWFVPASPSSSVSPCLQIKLRHHFWLLRTPLWALLFWLDTA